MLSIQPSIRPRRRVSKSGEGSHRSASSAMAGPSRLIGPCRGGPPGRFGRLQPGDRDQVVGGRRSDLRDGRGGRPEDRRDRPADPADPLGEEARHLVGTDERSASGGGPPRAGTCPGRSPAGATSSAALVRPLGERAGAPRCRSSRAPRRRRSGRGFRRGRRASRSAPGSPARRAPPGRPAGDRSHRAPARSCRSIEPVPARVQSPSAHGDESRGAASLPSASSTLVEPRLGEEAPHVGQDFGSVIGVRRHPVDDDQQRQPALVDARQDGPRHLVGVARRGRHEARTGRPPRRGGRSAPGWHARASRYPARRRGRGRARSRRRSRNEVGPGGSRRGRLPSTVAWSSGWTSTTATRVVGRRTPVALAGHPRSC